MSSTRSAATRIRAHSRLPKGNDRIDAHRAEGRNRGGRETRNCRDDASTDERERISCRHAKQLRLDVPSPHERTREGLMHAARCAGKAVATSAAASSVIIATAYARASLGSRPNRNRPAAFDSDHATKPPTTTRPPRQWLAVPRPGCRTVPTERLHGPSPQMGWIRGAGVQTRAISYECVDVPQPVGDLVPTGEG